MRGRCRIVGLSIFLIVLLYAINDARAAFPGSGNLQGASVGHSVWLDPSEVRIDEISILESRTRVSMTVVFENTTEESVAVRYVSDLPRMTLPPPGDVPCEGLQVRVPGRRPDWCDLDIGAPGATQTSKEFVLLPGSRAEMKLRFSGPMVGFRDCHQVLELPSVPKELQVLATHEYCGIRVGSRLLRTERIDGFHVVQVQAETRHQQPITLFLNASCPQPSAQVLLSPTPGCDAPGLVLEQTDPRSGTGLPGLLKQHAVELRRCLLPYWNPQQALDARFWIVLGESTVTASLRDGAPEVGRAIPCIQKVVEEGLALGLAGIHRKGVSTIRFGP